MWNLSFVLQAPTVIVADELVEIWLSRNSMSIDLGEAILPEYTIYATRVAEVRSFDGRELVVVLRLSQRG